MQQMTFEELNKKSEVPLRVCAFTGHREMEEAQVKTLESTLISLINDGVEEFLCGMAKGFDLYAASCVLNLKKKYPHIKLIACVPFYGQEKSYSQKDKLLYVKVLKNCNEIFYLSDRYYQGCMQNRNRYMADKADVLVAYLKKDVGGTAYTVKYFLKKNKRVIYI